MKKITATLLLCFTCFIVFSQKTKHDKETKETKEPPTVEDAKFNEDLKKLFAMDSIAKTFKYEYGAVQLKNGIASIQVPQGFKYLNEKDAEKVLVDFWGNPRHADMTLGLLLPDSQSIITNDGYVFNIQYEDIGYVKDEDAADNDYDKILKDMQEEIVEASKERVKQGYEPIQLIGWASKPFYDKDRKILHWAKEIKFGTEGGSNTLNYNVRILGRKGLINLNAIATMENLPLVKQNIDKVLGVVQFTAGNQYKDFDSKVDNVAAWTIGGLVAGKVLAKVGFFAVILKFWKIAAIAIVAFFGGIWKKIKGRKNEDATV